MMQRACSLILILVLVTGPVYAAGKKFPSSFNFLRLKSSTGVKAPLVIEPGVLTPSSEDGAIEFDGNDLYITKSGVKTVLSGAGTKGEKGDKGDTGERGPRGLAGPSGPAGPAGSFSGGDAVVSGILSFSTSSIAKFNGSILIPASAANGKVLTSNGGGLASWKTLPTSTPGGSSGQIQINNSGSFAGNGSLFWDFTNKRLGVGTSTPAQAKLKVVLGSAAEQGLVLQAAASQTGNLTEWRNSAGAVFSLLDNKFNMSLGPTAPTKRTGATGDDSRTLRISGNGIYDDQYLEILRADGGTGLRLFNTGNQWHSYIQNILGYLYIGTSSYPTLMAIGNASPNVLITSPASSNTPLVVKAAASQTANLTEWQNSAGTVMSSIDASGNLKFISPRTIEYRSNGIYNYDGATPYPLIDFGANTGIYGLKFSGYPYLGLNIERVSSQTWLTVNYGYGGSGATPRAALDVHGGGIFENNVGIGTASPARSLHISDTMRLQPRATAPTSPSLGDLYVDSDTNELCFYDGSTWTGLKAGGACI